MASVCRQLDGMPLAIELAAARLRSMSLAELHGRLDQRFRLLTGGSRTALERQQTLRAAVGWSYSLLTGAERLLLGGCRCSPGGSAWTPPKRSAGPGTSTRSMWPGCSGRWWTRAWSWPSQPGKLRYRLLETIRLFAAERLAKAGDSEAAPSALRTAPISCRSPRRPLRICAARAGQLAARLDADQANLLRAARHAAADADGTALVLRFGAALYRYWLAPARREEAIGLLQPVLERPDAAPTRRCTRQPSWPPWRPLRSSSTKLRFAEQAVQDCRRLGDDRLLIKALTGLSWARISAPASQGRAPLRAGGGRDRPPYRRRPADGHEHVLVSQLHRSGPVPPLYAEAIACTERSGDHSLQRHLAHQRGLGCPANRGHPRRQGAPGGRAEADARIGLEDATGWQTWAWCCARKGTPRRAVHDRGGPADRPPDRRLQGHGLRLPRPGLPGRGSGRVVPAALLHGISQAFLGRAGNPVGDGRRPLPPGQPRPGPRAPGDEQLEQAYTQGQTLSLDQAFELALRGADPHQRSLFHQPERRLNDARGPEFYRAWPVKEVSEVGNDPNSPLSATGPDVRPLRSADRPPGATSGAVGGTPAGGGRSCRRIRSGSGSLAAASSPERTRRPSRGCHALPCGPWPRGRRERQRSSPPAGGFPPGSPTSASWLTGPTSTWSASPRRTRCTATSRSPRPRPASMSSARSRWPGRCARPTR